MIDVVGNRTMRDLLDERTERDPDRDFLVFEDRTGAAHTYTYLEFRRQVDRVAAGLASLGVGQGDRVTVHLPNSPEILLSWFALGTLGAVMVPSNTANTPGELEHVLSFSQSVAVITQPSLLETVGIALKACPGVRHTILARAGDAGDGTGDTVSFESLLDSTGDPPRPVVHSEDVVQMLFTSGTTARPKGVLLTHANALRAGERASRSLALDAGERCLTSLPIFHVNAQSLTVMSALTVGGTAIVLEEYRASKFWSQVRAHKATQMSVVAMQARTLLAQPPDPKDADHHLRRVFYAINISTRRRTSSSVGSESSWSTATACRRP